MDHAQTKNWRMKKSKARKIKEFARKIKGDKKTKHKRRDRSSYVSLSKPNIARAVRDPIPKDPNFSPSEAKMKQRMSGELFIPPPNAPTLALQQVPPSTPTTNTDKISSKRNRRNPMYYGFEDMLSDFVICAPLKDNEKQATLKVFNYKWSLL